MLSDTLKSILTRIQSEVDINESILEKLIKYILEKSKDTYVYPEVLNEKFKIDFKTSFKICVILEEKGILKRVFKLYCPNCHEYSDNIFEDFNEIEEFASCEICGKYLIDESNPYKYIFIYFKVI